MNNFDELNVIEAGFGYQDYFGDMDLTEEEKKKRIKLAEQFEVLFLYFFLLYSDNKSIDYVMMIYEKYIEISLNFLHLENIPSYIDIYAKELANEIVRVTVEHDGVEFYTSKDRGMLISANEANMLSNYQQQLQAIKEGKRYKTWITEKDTRVRHTHRAIDEKRIGIFELFKVGDSLMGYPKDMTYSPGGKETCNCRCVVKYS